MKRDWTVPINLPERSLAAERGGEVEPVDPQEAQQTFIDLEATLRQLGGVLKVAPHRYEIRPGRWITLGYQIRYESFAEAIKQRPVDDEPEELDTFPDPELAEAT